MEFLFGDLNTVHAVGISMISMALVAASFNSFCVFFLVYDMIPGRNPKGWPILNLLEWGIA